MPESGPTRDPAAAPSSLAGEKALPIIEDMGERTVVIYGKDG
jgi:hypothetical protein